MKPRHKWSDASIAVLTSLYPHHTAETVAKAIGCNVTTVYNKAHALGLSKSEAFFQSQASGRMQRGQQNEAIKATQFKPGQPTWNKGIKGSTGHHPNCKATQFKPGQKLGAAQHNYVPLGSLRTSRDGYLERKTNDTHPVSTRRWEAVHRIVWQAAHGPIPKGYIVVFKPGQKTTQEEDITLDRLELITRAQNMKRNSVHTRMPPEAARLVQLKGAINRQVNRIQREHAQRATA